MFKYIWPLIIIVVSNVFYQICTKSVPDKLNPLASLTITYAVAALLSLILYYAINNKNANIIREYSNLNWAPFVLGLVCVGLEVGYIYAYKAGWGVSILPIVQSAIITIILIFVGKLLYKEPITWNKIVGIVVCLIGLGLISFK